MIQHLANRFTKVRWALLMFLASGFVAAQAFAQSQQTVHLPNLGVKNRCGLTLDLDCRGAEANGYRPVKVKFTNFPPTANTYDRQVRVTLKMLSGRSAFSQISVSQVVEIPEGATSGEAVVSVPSDGQGYYMGLEVREGGQRLDELCVTYLPLNARGGWGSGDEAFPSLLFISSAVPDRATRDRLLAENQAQIPETAATFDLPDVRNLAAGTRDRNASVSRAYGKITDRSQLALFETYTSMDLFPLAELPDRWIDLSTYSILFISRDDLKLLAKDFPQRKEALQQWLAHGTVLVVYDAGEEFEHLQEIEKLLELPPLPDANKKGVLYRNWMTVRDSDDHRIKQYGSSSQNNRIVAGGRLGVPVPATAAAENTKKPAADTSQQAANKNSQTPSFVSRPAQLGWLIAVSSKNPFPGEVDEWEKLLASIPGQRESWTFRHGMTLRGSNDGFWNWHIAGVGAAPVFSFILLATMFAIAIGPLNYLFLGRIRRLSLLLFTVPLGALLVTLSLFLYALVTDGLGVRSRVRSYTSLDQRSGQMVSWSRQTYFASVAPSRGLKYPADTLVFPLVLKQNDMGGTSRAIDWEPDGQRLKSGFLSSRALSQFMVVRSAKSDTRLEVVEQKSAPHLQVRNTLGSKVTLLVLRDSQGNYFAADNLPLDTTAEPAPTKAEDARTALTKLIKKQEPGYPEGYDPALSGNGLTRMFRGAFPTGGNFSPVHTSVSLMEKNISEIASPRADLLEPGTYLAIVDVCLDVPMGVPVSKQKDSLHVIRGRW